MIKENLSVARLTHHFEESGVLLDGADTAAECGDEDDQTH